MKKEKTYEVGANFEHSATFVIKAKSKKEAIELVEQIQMGIYNDCEYFEGNFGALLGIDSCKEVIKKATQ